MNTTYTRLALGLDGVIVDLDNTSNEVENLFTMLDGDIVHRMHITGKITQGWKSKKFAFDLLFRGSNLNDFVSAPAKATALVNQSLQWTLRKISDTSWFGRLGYMALENAYHDMEYTIRTVTKHTLDSVNCFKDTVEAIASED